MTAARRSAPTVPAVVQLPLAEIDVEVARKNVKRLRLVVSPPDGRVRLSAPRRMTLEAIRAFASTKLDWIRRQRARMQALAAEARREYIDGEPHPLWGSDRRLVVTPGGRRPSIVLSEGCLQLQVPAGADRAFRHAVVERFYRRQVAEALPPLLAYWQERMEVRVERFFVRRMKTRWGSCTPRTRTVRFNAELAKRPPAALEYIVVHELVHLLEPSHGPRFVAFMDRFLPTWRQERRALHRPAP